ncbi:MAG TPA: hypothetical protein VKU82_13530 [Planctomycetaceae bacterium]|nr:hypothetical protein [Planctomycetaceae bacterium]
MAIGEEQTSTIASEVTTGTSSADGSRDSADSEWTSFTVPSNFGINKEKTVIAVQSEAGSEHSYDVQYDDYVEVIPGTHIILPRTIRAQTHARSSTGPFGGRGWEKIKVTFTYVQFKN